MTRTTKKVLKILFWMGSLFFTPKNNQIYKYALKVNKMTKKKNKKDLCT